MTTQYENIPREAYTKLLHIKTRTATISFHFSPRKRDDSILRSSLLRKTIVYDSNKGDMPFFRFEISEKKHKGNVCKILLDYESFDSLINLVDSEMSGLWKATAAEARFFDESRLLYEQYKSDFIESNGILICNNIAYYKSLFEISRKRNTQEGIENSENPLLLMQYSTDNWQNCKPDTSTAGATMSVYYQPKTSGEVQARRPWMINITQYQLHVTHDGKSERIEQKSVSINLTSNEMNIILDKLSMDLGLWTGREKVVKFYFDDPKRYSRLFVDKLKKT